MQLRPQIVFENKWACVIQSDHLSFPVDHLIPMLCFRLVVFTLIHIQVPS